MNRIFLMCLLFILGLPQAFALKPIEQWKTKNGVSVAFYPAEEVPILTVAIAFAAGSAYDGAHFGLSQLTSSLLKQGSGKLDVTQIAEKLADSGGQVETQSSRDMLMLQLKTLTEPKSLQEAMEIFTLMLTKPAFRLDSFNQIKNQQLMAITQTEESPDDVATKMFFEHLYKNHPYAHPVNGTLATVKNITQSHVKDFYKKYFVGANATLVFVGAISSEKAHALAEALTKDLPEGQKAAAVIQAKPLTAPEDIKESFPSSQTVLRLGQLGVTHNNPDYFPLLVGNYILGGGSLVSRLSLDIREKQGLTYNVSSQLIPLPGEGVFVIGLSTKNDQVSTALNGVETILKQFVADGPNNQELVAAKKYLIGSFPQSLASNNQIAGLLLRLFFYKLPSDYLSTYTARIEAVQLHEIKDAFAKLIQPNKLLVVTVGSR